MCEGLDGGTIVFVIAVDGQIKQIVFFLSLTRVFRMVLGES